MADTSGQDHRAMCGNRGPCGGGVYSGHVYVNMQQITTVPDVEANTARVVDAIRAGGAGVDLMVFPEATMYPFGAGRLDTIAQPLDGKFVTAIHTAACEVGTVAVVGMFCPADVVERTRADGSARQINRVDNVAVVVGLDGGPRAYRKIHCYDAFGYCESDTVRPGEELVVIDVHGVKVGLAICYDIRFPEQFVQLAQAGAQVIAVPTSWQDGPGKIDQWRLVSAARALDSTSFIVAVDQARPGGEAASGVGEGPTGAGHSAVISPYGHRVVELGWEEASATVQLDLSLVEAARRDIPVVAARGDIPVEAARRDIPVEAARW